MQRPLPQQLWNVSKLEMLSFQKRIYKAQALYIRTSQRREERLLPGKGRPRGQSCKGYLPHTPRPHWTPSRGLCSSELKSL